MKRQVAACQGKPDERIKTPLNGHMLFDDLWQPEA